MTYNCEICKVVYKSRMGLYKHNKKNHIAQKPINNICKYCNKKLSSYKSKWRHEQQCKTKII